MKILYKRGEIAPKEQCLLFSIIFCCLLIDICVKTGTKFSLRDKRLLEVSEVEITRVDCMLNQNKSFTYEIIFKGFMAFSSMRLLKTAKEFTSLTSGLSSFQALIQEGRKKL